MKLPGHLAIRFASTPTLAMTESDDETSPLAREKACILSFALKCALVRELTDLACYRDFNCVK